MYPFKYCDLFSSSLTLPILRVENRRKENEFACHFFEVLTNHPELNNEHGLERTKAMIYNMSTRRW